MSDIQSSIQRSMLRGYEQQLFIARRLAHLRIKQRTAEGQPPHDPNPAIKRAEYVRKAAMQLYEHLIYTGVEMPMAEDIRKELGKKIGLDVLFVYPPGQELQVAQVNADGSKATVCEDQEAMRRKLWHVTLQQMDAQMYGEKQYAEKQQSAVVEQKATQVAPAR